MIKKILLILFLFFISYSLRNPAAVYCTSLGYKFIVKDDMSLCILPNGETVDAWLFLKGKVAKEYSYCKLHGLEIKTINDSKRCIKFLTNECAVCVFPNGTEIEVTELMGLDFRETVCGDKICGIPENYFNCPQDCPSGSYDGICDGVKDGKCDPDCIDLEIPEKDPDCKFCGNKICEIGENQENCCIDCGCPFGYFCKENRCETYFSSISIYLLLLVPLVIFLFFQIKKFKR
jgi:putative hemolysin